MLAALGATGNPASVHREGRAARRILEDARETIAARFGARRSMSCSPPARTEANALALHALRAGPPADHRRDRARRRFVAAAPGARLLAGGSRRDRRSGVADAMLAERTRAGLPDAGQQRDRHLQPVAEAAALCRRHGALLHVDAVQAAGRMPVDLRRLAPTAWHCRRTSSAARRAPGRCCWPPMPPPRDRAADRGRRAGARLARRHAGPAGHRRIRRGGLGRRPEPTRLGAAAGRDRGTRRPARARSSVGAGAPRLANTTCLALPGVRADAQVIALDLDGSRSAPGPRAVPAR